jgi:hypothetical protein
MIVQQSLFGQRPPQPLTKNHNGVPSFSPGLAAQRPTPGNMSHKIQPLISRECGPREARIKTAANSPKIQHYFPHPQTNPHPKSTLAHPKSTVDLGCELLIRVENGLRPPLSPTSYRPKSGPKIRESNQNQTVTGQKNLSCLPVDSGCNVRNLFQKPNQRRNFRLRTCKSMSGNFPTILTTSLSSMVASCALTPQGTFNPAACHCLRGKSVLASTDEIGTRNKSEPLRPTTIAGRTLRLVKSVNGIGRRTTSFREQFIENVVVGLAPGLQQIFLGKLHPVILIHAGLNRHADRSLLGKRQALLQNKLALLIDGFNRRCHNTDNLPEFSPLRKVKQLASHRKAIVHFESYATLPYITLRQPMPATPLPLYFSTPRSPPFNTFCSFCQKIWIFPY